MMGEVVFLQPAPAPAPVETGAARRYPEVAAELNVICHPERVEVAYAACNRRAMDLLIDAGLLRWRRASLTWDQAIDVEIDHPLWGWIPFTARPTDVEKYGRDIYWALRTAGVAKPYDYEANGLPPEAWTAFDGFRPPLPKPPRRWWQFWRKAKHDLAGQ